MPGFCNKALNSYFVPCLLTLGLLSIQVVSPARGKDVIPVPEKIIAEPIANAKPRNVVFILSDDHRYDAMSFLGHQFAETPVMDSMAKNGVYLPNALVTTSLCSPSRASILTGLYTFRHRVIDNQRRVPRGTLFFPQYLQQAGYRTGFVGKWHMGAASDEARPGFDYWVSFRGQGNYYPPGPNYTLNVNGKRVPQKGYITTELTSYALEFLDQQKDSDRPFFLYLSHKAVHGPFTPEPKYLGRFSKKAYRPPVGTEKPKDNRANLPRWRLDQRNSWHGMDFPLHTDVKMEDYYRPYCESLCSVDDSIGQVLAKLKAMGIHDDTLVIYMGDNGYLFGEHGLIDKRVAYETSIRVPLLMQCPNLFRGGTIVDEVVANIDIGPTILEAMGIKTPPHMDGQSFLPLAKGMEIPWRKYFLYVYYWEKNFPQTPTHFAIRGDRYKLISYYGLWDTDELFDLKADPHEQKNLYHDPRYTTIRKEVESKLYALMEKMGGMSIPLNAPRGGSRNLRLRQKGAKAADFPEIMITDQALPPKLPKPRK